MQSMDLNIAVLRRGHRRRNRRHWTATLEYLYANLGRVSGSFATTNTISAGGVVTTIVLNSNYSSRITDNVLRVGPNYRFDGPVVAKY
jgi:outer membrane immunogenic protein